MPLPPWISTPSYGLVQLPKQLTKSFEGNRYLVFRLTSLVYKFSFPLLLALRNYFVNLSRHSAVQFFHRLSRNKTHCSVFFRLNFSSLQTTFLFYFVLCTLSYTTDWTRHSMVDFFQNLQLRKNQQDKIVEKKAIDWNPYFFAPCSI